jgi:hypothetical protein
VLTSQSVEFPITWSQVAAFRVSRHHLMERAPVKSLDQVTGEMVGVQAQLLSAAQVAMWSRVRNLQIAHIDESLNERTLVKAACMRQTLFLVPSKYLAVFVRGSARRAEKEIRWTRGKGVPDRVIDAAIDAALDALDQPLTRSEIAKRVCQTLGVQAQVINGGGWGNRRNLAAVPVGDLIFPVVDLLHLVAARGVVCYGPNRPAPAVQAGSPEPKGLPPAVQAGQGNRGTLRGLKHRFAETSRPSCGPMHGSRIGRM